MIDIIPPEEESNEDILIDSIKKDIKKEFLSQLSVQTEVDIKNELHELNKTLKEILREMRKRKV